MIEFSIFSIILFVIIGAFFFSDRIIHPIITAPFTFWSKPNRVGDTFWLILNILALVSIILLIPIILEFCDVAAKNEYLQYETLIQFVNTFLIVFVLSMYAVARLYETRQIFERLTSPEFYETIRTDPEFFEEYLSKRIFL